MRLREIQSLTSTSSPKQVAEFILENCAPWLTATQNGKQPFFRGTSHEDMPVTIVRVRSDRKPRDSEQWRHNAFNAMIAAVGGIANRSNSAFVTRSALAASSYGRVRVYLPVGEFHYTWAWEDWSQEIDFSTLRDLVREEEKSYLKSLAPPGYRTQGAERDLGDPKIYDPRKLAPLIAVDRDLYQAGQQRAEVMVKSDYGVLVDRELYASIIQYL